MPMLCETLVKSAQKKDETNAVSSNNNFSLLS
jgi:hypothetical protein